MHNPRLIPVYIFATILIVALTVGVIISVIIQKQRQFRNKLARQQLAFNYSQSLLNTKIEVQETTLNMLAQELHDNITQALTGCFMQINSAAEFMEHKTGTAIINAARENIKDTIRDVRLLSHSLATGMVEKRELHDAIQAELSRIEAFSNIACALKSVSLHEPEPEQRLLLFRIVQEALQNVLKHAEANNITVNIDSDDNIYHLSISDDGKGFDISGADDPKTLGLMNIHQRVEMLAGSLKISSAPGTGTSVHIRIPIKKTNE